MFQTLFLLHFGRAYWQIIDIFKELRRLFGARKCKCHKKVNYLMHSIDLNLENNSLKYVFPINELASNQLESVYKWIFLYKWPLYDHSWPFFCHMSEYLSQNWGSDGHFEVLNGSKFWLGQKLWHELQIFPFLFFLPFCTKTDICIFFVFCIFVSFVITFVPIKI